MDVESNFFGVRGKGRSVSHKIKCSNGNGPFGLILGITL